MNRKVSVEKIFIIIKLFLSDFWGIFLKEKMINGKLINPKRTDYIRDDKGRLVCCLSKDLLYDDNEFFFTNINDNIFDEIFKNFINTNLSEAKKIVLDENFIFQLVIDFCTFFNNDQYHDRKSLWFAINYLINMKNHPKEHYKEWNFWNKIISDKLDFSQQLLLI